MVLWVFYIEVKEVLEGFEGKDVEFEEVCKEFLEILKL